MSPVEFRNLPIGCRYSFFTSGHVTKALCRMSNIKNVLVAMSKLVVQTHTSVGVVVRVGDHLPCPDYVYLCVCSTMQYESLLAVSM